MKRNDVFHKISPEFLHVFTRSLAADKFFPRLKKIFERNDIIVGMSEPLKTPPRTLFARFGKD